MAAKKTRPIAPTEAENCGMAKSFTSSDGKAMRRSYSTKPARTATAATSVPHARGSPKPISPPSMTP
jgi:hypothetical protein